KILLDAREQRLVLLQGFTAVDDAPVRDAAVDVLPDLLVEFRLLLHLPEYAHVGLDAAHHPGPGRIRNTFCKGARAKIVAPRVEAGWRRRKRRKSRHEQGAGADAALQQGAAGRSIRGIGLFHAPSLAAR